MNHSAETSGNFTRSVNTDTYTDLKRKKGGKNEYKERNHENAVE